MTIWHLDIAHVRIVGARAGDLQAGELRPLVERAVQRALASTALPSGRTVRTSIEVRVPQLTGNAAVAQAVAVGVTRAVGGTGRG